MARINNLTNFLTDVATAIKTKKGSSTAISAANFDTEILALPSQGVYQTKTITITENGTQTITPDTNYDAIEQLNLTINIPMQSLQTKSYTFTENQSISLLPDTGYDGFSSVNVDINVPAGGINEYASEQAMREAGLEDEDKAIVYNTTDKLVGYYEVMSQSGLIIVPSSDITYDNINHTASISHQNGYVLNLESIKTLLLNVATAYNWNGGTWGSNALRATLFRMNGLWYAGHMIVTTNTDTGMIPNFDGTHLLVTGNSNITSGRIKYCLLDLDNNTYDSEQTANCTIISYSTSRFVIGPEIETLPFYITYNPSTGEFTSTAYADIRRDYSTTSDYTVYTKTGDTSITGTINRYNLLDTGLVYGTQDADATDLDIIKDKTAYIDGVKVTGRLPVDRNINIDNHYNTDTFLLYGSHSSTDHPETVLSLYVQATTHFPDHWIQKRVVDGGTTSLSIVFPASQLLSYMNLTANKLLAGQKIWYLTGTATSDATATASDIMKDKTAYVNGQKITGTNEGGVIPTGTKSITENGVYDISLFANVDVNVPTTGVMTQEEYDEAVATLDDLLTGEYEEVFGVMNEVTDTPEDNYNGVGGTPTQIENTIDTLLGTNN